MQLVQLVAVPAARAAALPAAAGQAAEATAAAPAAQQGVQLLVRQHQAATHFPPGPLAARLSPMLLAVLLRLLQKELQWEPALAGQRRSQC